MHVEFYFSVGVVVGKEEWDIFSSKSLLKGAYGFESRSF